MSNTSTTDGLFKVEGSGNFTFNNQQQKLLIMLNEWWKNRPAIPDEPYVFVYSGKAGTGKTTIIKYFLESIGIGADQFVAVALAGKATTVLSSHGLPSSTIHSLIYNVMEENVLDENGEPILKADGTPVVKFMFIKKMALPESLKLIIVDELSMVNDELMSDLLSFKLPIIGMGDLNQLPPVFGISSWMIHPNFVLDQIMRQESGNPIVMIADHILNYKPLDYGDYGESRIVRKVDMGINLLTDYDIILCGKNKTRDIINNYIRSYLVGCEDIYPVLGDKMICRSNHKDYRVGNFFLTNGTIGRVEIGNEKGRTSKKMTINLAADFADIKFNDVDIDLDYLRADYEERKRFGITKYAKFEYGYAITVHLSQGSQYNRVLYFDEQIMGGREMAKKLRYTAVTRAIKTLDIVTTPVEYLLPSDYTNPSLYV